MSESIESTLAQSVVQKKKRTRRILIFCGVSLVNIVLLVLILTQLLTPAQQTVSDPLVGHPAPGFSLTVLGGLPGKSQLALADLRGRPVVLNFWASWCDPCQEEMPLLESTWKSLQAQNKDVVFVGIDFQESSATATSFLRQHGITYAMVLDANGAVANKYRIASLPDTFFINRGGTIVSKELQQLTAQMLTNGLQKIL
jgi:cytochrome c biogenesis protein CcmG/thiol:disulfide interchange protein DsbE